MMWRLRVVWTDLGGEHQHGAFEVQTTEHSIYERWIWVAYLVAAFICIESAA